MQVRVQSQTMPNIHRYAFNPIPSFRVAHLPAAEARRAQVVRVRRQIRLAVAVQHRGVVLGVEARRQLELHLTRI